MKTFFQAEGLNNREYYRSIIFGLVRRSGKITRAEISRSLGLRKATVSEICSEFVREGVLREERVDINRKGPSPLTVNPKLGCAIGIDLLPEILRIAVIDAGNNKVFFSETKTPKPAVRKNLIHFIKSQVAFVIDKVSENNPIGIGWSDPGLVDPERGVSISSSIIEDWREVPIKQILEDEFNLPVLTQGSNHVVALAEMLYGKAKGLKDFICIYLGIGIDSSIVINGNVCHGANNTAGEFGHIIIEPDGQFCECGGRGCLETVCSKPRIIKSVISKIQEGAGSVLKDMCGGELEKITVDQIIQAAHQGDRLSLKILEDTGRQLGMGVASLINVINPSKIIFRGSLMKAGEFILSHIEQVVRTRSLKVAADKLVLETSDLGEEAAALGAAILVLEKYFKTSFREQF